MAVIYATTTSPVGRLSRAARSIANLGSTDAYKVNIFHRHGRVSVPTTIDLRRRTSKLQPRVEAFQSLYLRVSIQKRMESYVHLHSCSRRITYRQVRSGTSLSKVFSPDRIPIIIGIGTRLVCSLRGRKTCHYNYMYIRRPFII